jgi:hypothetical protein
MFALMLVGARHHEAIKAAPREFLAQKGKMCAVAVYHLSLSPALRAFLALRRTGAEMEPSSIAVRA